MKGRVAGFVLLFICVVLVGSSWGYTESISESSNDFFGYSAGSISIGNSNCSFGKNAGHFTNGDNNSHFGYEAGYSLMSTGNPFSANNNSFVGAYAGHHSIGDNNSFVGVNTGKSNSGSYNSFLGANAGYTNSSGSANSFFGYQAGYTNSLGDGNVFIGNGAGYSETLSNKLYIDNCYTGGLCTSPFIKGDFSTSLLEINGAVTVNSLVSVSDERYKRNIQPLQLSLDKVIHLTGVSYEWKKEDYQGKGFREGRQIGLIAQDVEKVLPELVQTDDKGYKAVAYDKLVPVLIEAMKEQLVMIKEQQKEIKEKTEETQSLKRVMLEIASRLAALESTPKTVASK